MVMDCQDIWREISNYLEGDVDPTLRAAMEEHFRGCKHCTAVLDGTRNIVELYGDERMAELPLGFSYRLHRRLEENLNAGRRRFLGWALAAAAAVLVAGGLELGRSPRFASPHLRSEHARPGGDVPPEIMVVVSGDGKMFHASAGCPLLHHRTNLRTLAAREAIRDGYTPCTRCMKEYLKT